MRKRMKRILSLLLVCMMCITSLPVSQLTAKATENDWTGYMQEVTPTYDEENGYYLYKISTPQELAWAADGVNNWTTESPAVFRLIADIDLSAHEWIPMGKTYNRRFTDTFDGNGHTVSGVRIGSESSPYSTDNACGFFGYLYGPVENLKLTDAEIYTNGELGTASFAGLLAGQMGSENGTTTVVKNVETTGSVSTSGTSLALKYISNGSLGGLVGTFGNGGVIDSCRTEAALGALDASHNYAFGGIAGSASTSSEVTIRNCVSAMSISLPEDMDVSHTTAGALFAVGKTDTVINCIGRADYGKAVAADRTTDPDTITRTNVCFAETNFSRQNGENYELQSPAYTYYDADGTANETTQSDMKSAGFVSTLNTAATAIDGALSWSIDADKNGGFPDLAGAGVGEGNGEQPTVNHTVTFLSGGVVYKTETVEKGQAVARPEDPEGAEGDTFQYWYAADEATVYDFNTPVTGDLTLNAKWKGSEFTVRFDSMGGSYVYPQTVTKGEKASEPEAPTKKGSVFGGWYTDVEYTADWDFDTAVTGPVTLYAKWDKTGDVPVTGRITDADSGSGIRFAMVTLSNGQNAVADEFGYYRITDVKQGSYSITATAAGYNASSEEGFIVGANGACFDAALTQKAGASAATVNIYASVSCVYSGIMLDGVQVKAVGEGELGTYTETTKDGGLALFTGLPAGSYTFYVNQTGRAGWESYTSGLKTLSGDYQLSCALKPNYQSLKINVRGSFDPVSNKSGQPLSGKNVHLTGVDPTDEEKELINIDAYTDSSGSVTVDKLVPINWKISCSDFSYEEKEESVYADGSGHFSAEEVTLTLPFVDSSLAVSLTSIYEDPDLFKRTEENKDNLPVVSLTGIAGTTTEGIVRTGQPDASGKIIFTGLFPGNYNLSASGKVERYVSILSGDQKEIFDSTDFESFSRFGKKHFDIEFTGNGTAAVALGARAESTIDLTAAPVSFSGTLYKTDMDENGQTKSSTCANTKIIIKPSAYYPQTGANASGKEITTDAQGRYSVSLAPGLYGVEVESRYKDYFGGHLTYHEGNTDGYVGSWGWPCTGKWTGSKASAVAWMTSDDNQAYGDIGGMSLSSGSVIADLEMLEKKISYSAGSPGNDVIYDNTTSYHLITGFEKDEEPTVDPASTIRTNLDSYENTYQTMNYRMETRGATIKLKGNKNQSVDMTGKTFPYVFTDLAPGEYSLEYQLSAMFSQAEPSVSWGGEIQFFDFPAPGLLPSSFPEDYATNNNPWPLSTKYSGLRIDPKKGSRQLKDLYDGDNSNGELQFQFYQVETYDTFGNAGIQQSVWDENYAGKFDEDDDMHFRRANGEIGDIAEGIYPNPPVFDDVRAEWMSKLDKDATQEEIDRAWENARNDYENRLEQWEKDKSEAGFPKQGAGFEYISYQPGWSGSTENASSIIEKNLVAYSTSLIPDKLFYIKGSVTNGQKALPGGTLTLYFCAPKGRGYQFLRKLSYIRNRERYESVYNSDLWFSVTVADNALTDCTVNVLDQSQCSSAVKILTETQINHLLNPRTIEVKAVDSGDLTNILPDVVTTITYAGRQFSSSAAAAGQTCSGEVTAVEVAADEYEWEPDTLSNVTSYYDEGSKTETFFVPMRRKKYSCEIQVKDEEGQIVKNASIRLTGDTHGEPVYALTGDGGKATVTDKLTYQDYTLYVSADGYGALSASFSAEEVRLGNTKNVSVSRAPQPTIAEDSVSIDRKGAFLPGVSFVGSSNTIEFLTNLGSGDLYYTVTAQVDTASGDSLRELYLVDRKFFHSPDSSDIPEALNTPVVEGSTYNPSACLEWVEKLRSGAHGTVYYRSFADEQGFSYTKVLNDGGYHYEFTKTYPLWELPPDGFEPCVVAVTARGAVQIYEINYEQSNEEDQLVGIRLRGDAAAMLNNITVMANAKAVGGKAVEKLAEISQPTGSLIPLPSFESGIELDDDGFLTYNYTIEMQLLQGKKSVSDAEKSYMSILPSTLGIAVAGAWNMELAGKERELSNSFDVKVEGSDMDALDYLPSAFKALPVKVEFDEDNPPTGKFTFSATDTIDKNNHNTKETYSFGANGQVHVNAEVSAFSSFAAVLPVGPVLASLEKSGALDIGAHVKVAVGADGTYTYTIENGSETSHEVTFTLGAGAGIGFYAKALGGALGAEANLRISGDNDKLEDMVTISATVDKEGFHMNSLDGKVVADAHIEIDTWFISGEKDFTFAEIPFSYQFGTVTQFNLAPITVKDTTRSRDDFEAASFNGKPESLISGLLPIGGYATDEAAGGTFLYTDMSKKGGNVRLLLSQYGGNDIWQQPAEITQTDGLIPAFDVISLDDGRYLAVWTQIAKADMMTTCPPSVIRYSVGTIKDGAWSGDIQTLTTLTGEVASKLLLVSDQSGVSLAVLRTAEGAMAEHLSISGYRYNNTAWSAPGILVQEEGMYDISACSAGGTLLVSYVGEDKKVHVLSWKNSVSEEIFDAVGFETAMASDGTTAYLLSESDKGLKLRGFDGSWKEIASVASASNIGSPALKLAGNRAILVWSGDNDRNLYRISCTKAGTILGKETLIKASTTGRFEDTAVFTEGDDVSILTVLNADTDFLNVYAGGSIAHTHEWRYTASGATITATCLNTDGGHDGAVSSSLTILKPALTAQGGSQSAAVTLAGSLPVATPAVVYKKNGAVLSAPPKEAGTYTASITAGGVTATLTYTIAAPASSGGTQSPATVQPAGTPITDTATNNTYVVTSDNTKKPEVAYVGTQDSKATSATIPATVNVGGTSYKVTAVEEEAFKGDTALKSVSIGSNVETIGTNAFAGCTSLTSITIPASVTKIGDGAFNGDKKLTKVTVGKNVTSVGKKAFSGCSFKTITLPAKTTKIGAQVFDKNKKLRVIILKSTKLTSKTIKAKAFKGISTKVTIKVPKAKLKAYKKLFVKKGLPKKVKIKKI